MTALVAEANCTLFHINPRSEQSSTECLNALTSSLFFNPVFEQDLCLNLDLTTSILDTLMRNTAVLVVNHTGHMLKPSKQTN